MDFFLSKLVGHKQTPYYSPYLPLLQRVDLWRIPRLLSVWLQSVGVQSIRHLRSITFSPSHDETLIPSTTGNN